MARLRFWQSALTQPSKHELLLSTFFGQFVVEGAAPCRDHPWHQQLVRDLRLLYLLDAAGDWVEELVQNPIAAPSGALPVSVLASRHPRDESNNLGAFAERQLEAEDRQTEVSGIYICNEQVDGQTCRRLF